MKVYVHLRQCVAQFCLQWEMFRKNVVKKIKKKYVQELFSENCAVYEIIWKNTVQPDKRRRCQ
jgi:hypothetical protein